MMGLKGQEDETVSVIGAQSPRGVPAGQESVFRDAATTRAEIQSRMRVGKKCSDFSFFLPVSCRYFPLARYKQKSSDKEPR